jgi:putative oxidoreductase
MAGSAGSGTADPGPVTLGPGRVSVDAAAGITVTGWPGGGIAPEVAVVATAGMLATFWRPHPRR